MGQIGKFRIAKYEIDNEINDALMFFCPGCNHIHTVTINGKKTWTFNNNYDIPTLSPSVITHGTEDLTEDQYKRVTSGEKIEPKKTVCHLFLKNGMLEFLSDCTHFLKGKTVPLPDLPDWLKD